MSVKFQGPLLGVLLFSMGFALPVCAQSPAATTTSPTGDVVVATVGDRTIRMSDVEQYWQQQDPASFARMRQQVYEVNRRVLEDLIGETLLQNEAKKRNVTVDQLVATESPKRSQPVTEDQIKELYEQSREKTQGMSLEALRPAIVSYLEQQRPAEARRRYIDELRKASKDVAIKLDVPRTAIKVLPTDPVTGGASARVEIVEFSDFQCPYCRQVAPVLKQIMAKYGDRVKLVWKDFPLPSHPDARPAAEAAQCANDQGKFWAYHDKLFENQNDMSVTNLKEWAAQMGMDATKFNACFDKGTHRQLVQQDQEEGSRHGVSSTPSVFINGRALIGAASVETYGAIIEEELARR
jgi:protein-disulfide isomerase